MYTIECTEVKEEMNIYEKIKYEIVKGEIKHGERLVEVKLSEKFGVSRTPIREAIKRLEKDGLVTWHPNRGANVRYFSIEDITSAYNLKAIIESYAASLAAEQRKEEHMTKLVEVNKQFDELITNVHLSNQKSFIEKIVSIDRLFHKTVIEASTNSYIPLALSSLISLPLIYQTYYWYDDEGLARASFYHNKICKAIINKDTNLAKSYMASHIYQGRDHVLQNIKEKQPS